MSMSIYYDALFMPKQQKEGGIMPNKESIKGCKCYLCESPFSSRNYYKSNSKLISSNGYLPICKKCLSNLFNIYNIDYHSCKKAVQRICMAFDIYYSDTIYNMCEDDDGNVSISKYIQKTNMVQYKGKTFDTSLEEGFRFTGNINGLSIGLSENTEEESIDPKLIQKWGAISTSVSDYNLLEDHYKMLKRNNPNANNNQEIFIISLCHINMMMMKALKENDWDNFAKANDQYSKTFTKAGLKTVQELDMGSDDCWGEWVRRIEDYTPAEYYKNKSLFKDFDNVGDYFKRFVLRPLRNLMHGTTDRDEEFCVKDGDNDDYSEPA